MKKYEEKTFQMKGIKGLSEKQLDVHLGLYKGYVTHINKLYETIEKTDDVYIRRELSRRIGFELCGLMHHEMYFSSISNGASDLEDSNLEEQIKNDYGSKEGLEEVIKEFGATRGIGWILVVYDKNIQALQTIWVSDHELGTVNLPVVLAVDMWEHAYMVDYVPSEKGDYIQNYLKALNWKYLSQNFDSIS